MREHFPFVYEIPEIPPEIQVSAQQPFMSASVV